ncbi:hypothetical protein P0136_07450 [Lentisphaerota bacterium ZTH]|nr:hypothetical protein JYG24_01435 [Lentisphaerota bacterium]WET05204.1 hypothetical protein P0136_07450 [Lentisphaerota bacterium ZTH]
MRNIAREIAGRVNTERARGKKTYVILGQFHEPGLCLGACLSLEVIQMLIKGSGWNPKKIMYCMENASKYVSGKSRRDYYRSQNFGGTIAQGKARQSGIRQDLPHNIEHLFDTYYQKYDPYSTLDQGGFSKNTLTLTKALQRLGAHFRPIEANWHSSYENSRHWRFERPSYQRTGDDCIRKLREIGRGWDTSTAARIAHQFLYDPKSYREREAARLLNYNVLVPETNYELARRFPEIDLFITSLGFFHIGNPTISIKGTAFEIPSYQECLKYKLEDNGVMDSVITFFVDEYKGTASRLLNMYPEIDCEQKFRSIIKKLCPEGTTYIDDEDSEHKSHRFFRSDAASGLDRAIIDAYLAVPLPK